LNPNEKHFVPAAGQLSIRTSAPHKSIGNARFNVTFFDDQFAQEQKAIRGNLVQLRDTILKTKARNKGELKWLKLARFGDKPTDKGSFRHDENVVEISGVELDYDGEKVTIGDGLRALQALKCLTLIYSTPSHTAAAPRWRVLAPTSKPLPPEQRHALL